MTTTEYDLRDKIDRACKMATTYLQKASNALHWTERRPISPGYWRLLDQALDTALDVVDELPDDFFEDRPLGDPFGVVSATGGDPSDVYNQSDDVLERAEKVVAALKRRREQTDALRLIRKLEDTTGRTPEEADAFRAKATQLRGKLKGAA